MVGFPGPHDPYNPPPDWAAMFDPRDMPEPLAGTRDTETFRADHVRAHAGGSARVDLDTFPTEVKRRIRAHYCALVAMIDAQVGAIVAAADARTDGRDTIVIFAADHGDFLGDYDFLGKNLFFEAAMHVPLIVRVPGGPRGKRAAELVTVTDIFATLLAAGGVANETGRDSFPLAAIAADGPRRTHALGALANGVAIDDGRYRLARYGNGLATLYDFAAEGERSNLIDRPEAQDVRARLDSLLATAVLGATAEAHQDKRYPYVTVTPGHPAHRRGWQRPYPWPTQGEPGR
jgi:arylsulfatase A-like enzyme